MLQVTFKATGPLHQNPQSHFKKAVDDSLNQTAQYGKGLIQDRTPVRTGNLRRGWESAKQGTDSISIFNRVRYTPFVEKRVGMMFRSEAQIQDFLNLQLDRNIPKAFS
jgi:hypothetical protein